ncbi:MULTISPECIES: glycosyltransferase [Mesonia]|nr:MULTISPECIES: glycosyltransferase [Mesonia]MAN27487.1 transmembrane family-2 glycosyl transferase [Mesonia sp.]MAQ42504.1 transmembrane family-2 glycosyl transferase [Mesonia sp.]MBJ96867.1 transmembrane family-2 glycosyl transferase [Flavobacteriaceae bacterium]|tara:strand:+ start:8571 stop:9695 length:1125 start_codon:yes stop_codon:yes gene_type:complete
MEIIISMFISASYATLMLWLLYGIFKLKTFHLTEETQKASFSICIPFRDEAENLPQLLISLEAIDYSTELFEIIFINDGSGDDSVKIVEEFIQQHPQLYMLLLHNSAKAISPKKEALSKAIQHSSKEYLVTTDADCEVPKKWLLYFNAMIIQQKSEFIAGPVSYISSGSFLDKFQTLDFLSLQAATLGGFGNKEAFLCNGANLCYKKDSFLEVNGFDNDKIASGDDIFLLEKMQLNKKKINYLSNVEACVKTLPPQTFKALLKQRIRWASKTSAYKNKTSLLTAVIVFLANLFFLIFFFGAIFQLLAWQAFILLLILKLNLDFFILYKTAEFYEQPHLMKSYIPIAFLHPLFIVNSAFLSILKSYEWKGRNFKK